MLTVKVPFDYWEGYLPTPRCRKLRYKEVRGEHEAIIREVQAEEFPLAIRFEDFIMQLEKPARRWIDLHWLEGRLWKLSHYCNIHANKDWDELTPVDALSWYLRPSAWAVTATPSKERCVECIDNAAKDWLMCDGNELYKTVTAPYAARALQMDEGAVIRYVCPELDACYGCEQNNRYHYMGVFSHTMKALENAETCHRFPDSWADGYVRMALLLHDIGKPATKTTDEDGHDHFYGHSHVSADMALNVLKRYRYSNEFVDTVVGLIDAHDIVFTPTKATARRMLNKFGVEQLHRLLKLRECDNRAHTSLAFERFEIKTVPFETILQQVLDEDSAFSIKDLTVNGHDIIKMGYKEGPEIGNILKALLDAVITDTCENTKEALTEYIKNNC